LRHTSPLEGLQKEARLMKEGRARYVIELRKQLERLNGLLVTSESHNTLDAAAKLYRLVHTLKGSAPMFGFNRIGTIAEQLVQQWEWAQSGEVDHESGFSVTDRFSAAASEGGPLFRQLTMELDIYVQELGLDEQQDQFTTVSTVASGSRLLVIDEDDVLRSYLVRRLTLEGYEVDDARDAHTAKKLMRQITYDLITLDLMMHPQSGYELFEFVKQDPTLKWVPVIVLSGRSDFHDKVRCFQLGADDYITKPFQYEELSIRIYSQLKRTQVFEQMAFRDPLTGVYNRRYFDHQVTVELQRIQRYPAPISLAFIDIDRFKSINDTHGHHVGDLVLQGMSHLLQNHLGATDVLARLGGEEFVVVFPGSSAEEARLIVEDILQHTRTGPVAQNEGQAYHVTFSAGVCEWVKGLSVDEWIKCADHAMYTAKQSGRDRVLLFTGGMSAPEHSTGLSMHEERRKTVLIAADDRILRSILVTKLRHLPLTFVEVVDGIEAYEIISKQLVDLCILDGPMPRQDGFEMLAQLKEKQGKPEGLQVLMLSGRSREEDMSRGVQLGVDAFMPKPFSMVELEFKVKQMLGLV
jgi:two-component system cell cycle response regulator